MVGEWERTRKGKAGRRRGTRWWHALVIATVVAANVGNVDGVGATESADGEVATGRVCVDPGLHDVSRRSQSASPPALVPGVVKAFDIGTGWLVPEAGSIQAARHPGGSTARFTEMVRWVGM